jgi:D-glycero-D-manno-heptose 1,7-bisphosphate phosphatase
MTSTASTLDMRLVPGLLLDRDGVIHREIGYLHQSQEVQFTDSIFDVCRRAFDKGYRIIIVTNQAGIGRGLYSEEDFHALMHWMQDRFAAESAPIAGYYYCPHHPVHGIGRFQRDCPDRKPQPGMILRAAKDHHLDLSQSILIGDRCSDLQAGAAAGISRLFLLQGTETAACEGVSYRILEDLRALVDLL